jgi:hypothetical protein
MALPIAHAMWRFACGETRAYLGTCQGLVLPHRERSTFRCEVRQFSGCSRWPAAVLTLPGNKQSLGSPTGADLNYCCRW